LIHSHIRHRITIATQPDDSTPNVRQPANAARMRFVAIIPAFSLYLPHAFPADAFLAQVHSTMADQRQCR